MSPPASPWQSPIFYFVSTDLIIFVPWSLTIFTMSSRFILVLAGIGIAFLRVYIPLWTFCRERCILLIQSSVQGRLGCFHLLAIVRSAAVNICVRIPDWVPAFSFWGGIYPEGEQLDQIQMYVLRVTSSLEGLSDLERP